MRKTGLIVVFIIILFIAPSAYTPQMMPTLDGGSRPVESGPTSADGGYPLSTGTGQALTTHILGTVVNGTEVPVQIDTDNMAVGTIGITGDYAGTGIGATLDTFTMTVPNALRNPDLNDWHEERWHVGDPTFYDDKVAIPDSWTLVKSISNPSESPHPHHGDWEFNDGGGGYAGSRGFRFDATLPTGYLLTSTDKIYISQHVHAPWRDLYSATIRFQYYVRAASQMGDLVHLFTRFAGVETQFRVFESGDTKDTWLPAIVEIPSSSLTSVNLPDSLLFEIGLGTNFDGITATGPDEYVFIDEIELELEVRPFPEQVGLRVNGTEVVGSTPGSTFPFVPDDITGDTGRDCWDDTSGIDLDGYDNDGNLEVGIWGTDWLTSNPFEVGLQFRLDIPQGAVIERAYLETEASGQQNLVDRRVHIAGENSSGLPVDPFENHLGLHLEDEFNWIQTSIDWQPDYWTSDVRYSSPDIAPLLQKVVSNSDWAAGQYVAIMLSYAWSSSYQSRNDLKGSNHPSWNNYTQDEMARFYVWYRIPHSDDVIPTNEDFARNSLQFRKDITIDSAKVTEDLSDFPVLIDLYDTDLRTDVRPDGEDIAFIVGGQFVEHEVELFEQDYNTTHAHLIAWVKIPSLSSSVDTVITMLYGNLIVTGLQSSGVWDGYEIVQHMNDNPNGISYDSTYNHHSGPSFGSMTIGDLVPGAIGNATDFDGQDDVISVGQIETDDWPSFTVSGWIYHDVSGDDRVFSKAPNTNEANAIIHFAVDDTDKFRVRMNTDGVGGGASLSVDSIGFTAPGSWYYLTWSWSAATEEMRLHINGTFDRTAARDGDTVLNSYVPFVIGNWQTGTGNNRFFDGMIDEIRMTTRVLSDGWIATEYANQKSPSSFYLVGPEQTSSGLPDIKSAALVFSSESPIPVSIGFTMSMDFEGTGKSLDENLNEGTTFYATNGSSTVEWTAKVLVSPPPGITQTEVYVEYPATEWTPISVANPLGQSKTAPAEWTFTGGRLAIAASAVDVYGLWTIKFESLSYIADLEFDLGGGTYADTAVFQINDDLEMRATSFWLAGSTSQLFLTDPSGSLWSTPLSNTTGGSPQHEIPSFVYRKVITVDRNKVQQDFTDFPVLIDIVDSDLDDKAQTDGDDIVFVQNGIIVPHEIVDYDPAYSGTEARLVAWIRANVSSSVDTDITMYYGNSLVGPQEQPSEVWSNGYVGVWHLEESPSGTSGEIKDSTSYRNDGTTEGSMNSADLISAMIGNGLDFDEIDDLIRVSDSVSLDSVASSGTIQMWIWFDMDAADGDRDVIMESSNRFDGNPDDGFELATQEDGDLFFYPWGGEGNDYNIALNQFANQTWHLLTVALDYSTKTVDFYVDGSLIAFTYEGAPTYWTQLAEPTDWLWGGDPDMPARYFDGRFDEIRVSNTVRSQTWLQTEFNNQDDPGSFSLVGSEQQRQFYYPEFKKTLDSTAPAGVWTATVRFNDSGSAIDYRVGIYERNFTVKHDTMLTLQEPSDAVVDRLSIAVAGDWIYIEYKLEDSVNSQSLSGVTVTMNWTVSGSGTLVTLDDYNTGVYGRMLNTADLGDAKRWRINLQTSHPFYNNATEYFDLDLYHSTSLDYGGVMTTPADFNFSAILTFTDVYDNVPIEGATITRSDAGPLTVAELGQGLYNISIETTALSLGDHWYVLEAEKPGYLFEISTTNVTFTLRQHYTSVSVQGDLTQPYGFNTDLTIVLTDLDTGGTVPLSEVSSFSFNPASYGVQNRPGSSYDVTLTTNTWSVTEPASETVTLSVVMSGTKYATPQPYSFDITIRAHYTSLTVSGVVVQPFGNVTPLTVFLWDHDTEASVPIGEVGEFSFARGFDIDTFSNPSSYDVMYDTSDWAVGIWSVTLSVDIPSSVYQNPSDYTFSVTIRSMTTVMYHDPKDLVFSAGEDFTIDLRVNVSEPGDSYGLPVRSLTQAEFSEPSYPFTVDNAAQNIGKYTFTISWSDLSGVGVYTITVYLTPLNASHGSTQLVITFRYRDVISTLTSPNYPQVTTPYQTDVQILLNYTDVEGGVGIDSATVSSPDHPEYIANWTDVGGGIY
ncbi:MAG: LamG-like jellyroll fold domain-containing protein, partial [Candidatus Thorarchaeota archaeon]